MKDKDASSYTLETLGGTDISPEIASRAAATVERMVPAEDVPLVLSMLGLVSA